MLTLCTSFLAYISTVVHFLRTAKKKTIIKQKNHLMGSSKERTMAPKPSRHLKKQRKDPSMAPKPEKKCKANKEIRKLFGDICTELAYTIELPSENWEFRGNRVLVFDTSKMCRGAIPQGDLDFLLKMYERDDIAVITKGAVGDHEFCIKELLNEKIGTQTHDKFVMMKKEKASSGVYYETGYEYQLTGEEYAKFLEAQEQYYENPSNDQKIITLYTMPDETKLDIDLSTMTLYMKDVYLPDFSRDWNRQIINSFKLPTLPFEEYCFMESVSRHCDMMPYNACSN